MAGVEVRKSSYFEAELIDGQFDVALEYYIEWCQENNQEPEVSATAEMMEISDSEFEHVLYHANLQGFEIT